MTKLLPLLAVSVLLAHISQQNTENCAAMGRAYYKRKDMAYTLLVVILILFSGLRTSYNDTLNYINGFGRADTLDVFLSDPEWRNPFTNPLFQLYESALKTWSGDPQMLIFTSAAFTQICFMSFLKRYSENFTFSVFVYITLGTFVFTLAAIKQVLAMAMLTLAFPHLQRRNWIRYYLIVWLAMLLHTYALAFAVLPLFQTRPWKTFTFAFLAMLVVVMLNFEGAITAFMEQANDLGKSLADYEVFDDATINVFRLAVYAVTPAISFAFRRRALYDNSRMDNVLVHMSIISLAFMILGTQSGANMFGRMSNYFELGTICCLPNMLRKTFDNRSYKMITSIACICFIGFFVYANAVKIDFDQHYRAMGLFQFLFS